MWFYFSIVKSTEGKTSGSPKILISSSNHSLQLLQPGTNMLAFIITPKTVHTWNKEKFNMGGHLYKDLVFCSFPCLPFFFIPETSPWALTLTRGGSRGRVQGVRTPRPWDDLRFSNTTGILQKKTMWFIGVEAEQETSAPPPKKNPGSAPAYRTSSRSVWIACFWLARKFFFWPITEDNLLGDSCVFLHDVVFLIDRHSCVACSTGKVSRGKFQNKMLTTRKNFNL